MSDRSSDRHLSYHRGRYEALMAFANRVAVEVCYDLRGVDDPPSVVVHMSMWGRREASMVIPSDAVRRIGPSSLLPDLRRCCIGVWY